MGRVSTPTVETAVAGVITYLAATAIVGTSPAIMLLSSSPRSLARRCAAFGSA